MPSFTHEHEPEDGLLAERGFSCPHTCPVLSMRKGSTCRRKHIVVLPYATPINGPHASFMVHLWGFITGKGKKCKILRAALRCTLSEALPSDTMRACYLKQATGLGHGEPPSATTAVAEGEEVPAELDAEAVPPPAGAQGACGWRPARNGPGELELGQAHQEYWRCTGLAFWCTHRGTALWHWRTGYRAGQGKIDI